MSPAAERPHARCIAIIGAGLGGLTAALALLRAGFAVRVYERAQTLTEVGAGISLSPGSGRGLATLGIGPALLAASLPVPDVGFAHDRSGRCAPPAALIKWALFVRPPIDTGTAAQWRSGAAGRRCASGAAFPGPGCDDNPVAVPLSAPSTPA